MANTVANDSRRGFSYRYSMNVAAHRGDSYNVYENTMEAFESARVQGADMIETDIRMTSDGDLVLIHDPSVYRTTGTAGLISKMTLAEIRALNAGGETHRLQIPTLEEFLEWAGRYDFLINLELKEYHKDGNEERCRICVDKTVEMVRKYGLEDRIVLNSFDAWPLEYADEAYAHRFLLHGFYPYSTMFNVKRDPDTYLFCACISGTDKRKEDYEHLLRHGIEPWVGASVTSREMLSVVCGYGAKLVTTNNPADAIQKLKELGKRT